MIKRSINVYNKIIHLLFIAVSISCILPLLLLVSVSLSKEQDIIRSGYSLIPKHFTVLAYQLILEEPGQLLNSYLVTTCSTILGTLIGMWLVTSLAYVLTRKDFKYRKIISFIVFFTMLFNGGLVPSYILIARWLGIKNTIFVLFVPYLVSAWYVLVMKGFLQSIPDSMAESAKIDGAGEVRIFVRIILPLAKPALATVALFMVLQYWNDWYLSLLFIDKNNLMTLQYLLMRVLMNLEFLNSEFARKYMNLGSQDIPTLTARMSMCLLAAGPMLLVFPFFQKYFVKGLTLGSVKG